MLSSFFTSKADILIWCHHCMLILSANLFIDLIAQVEKFPDWDPPERFTFP